ncbi:peptide deformylase [Shimia ponticola]|uniref:peptide deformylase n=1 Tax=Shimia ponticola TaxID=2582893 RepID=UPI0011BFDF25|nr:peptide deformylase [Shimia ponticola]
MALREIVLHPDPRLAERCAPVTEFGPDLATLVEDMFETMYDAPGRGLAAPQVGVLSRVFVMDATWKDGPGEPIALINPRITWASQDMAVLEEGCLSIPDTPRHVARPDKVRVVWQDLSGDWHEAGFDGFAAAVVQHESDHLDGRLILDHPEAA